MNNDRARTSSAIFIGKVVETNTVGQRIMTNISITTVGLITQLVQVAIAKINSFSSEENNNTSTVPPTTNTNSYQNSSTYVTNNFSSQQRGSQVTFDYEDKKFWV